MSNTADHNVPVRTTLITVTYNSSATLTECWSDYDSTWADWVVVDNASTDDSASVAESLGARVIRLKRNVGFSAANNIGAAVTANDVLIFCNPDVVVDKVGIQALSIRVLKTGHIVAPQLLNTDLTLQENGRGAPFPHRKVLHMFGNKNRLRPTYSRLASPGEFRQVVWAMGAAVALSRNTFARIGGWNANYFIYYEDAEFCLRALKHQVLTFVDGDVNWIHHWSRETSRGFSRTAWKHEFKSGARFYVSNLACLIPLGRTGRRLRMADHLAARDTRSVSN